MMMLVSGTNGEPAGGNTTILPPESPLPRWSFASPSSTNVMPGGMNAPKLWPAEPLKRMRMVSSGSPCGPYFRVISLPVIVPTTRFTLRIGSSARTRSPRSMAGLHSSRRVVTSSALSSP